jgi:hypothetical protein
MLLTKARQVVELNNPGVKTVEAVLTVPVYYTDAQRRAVLDAAEIARIKCLRLMNEGTAAALSFGMFKGVKKEFPEGKETPVLFLDMGASGTTATVATFTNASLRVLSSVGDASLGGRDIDVAVAKHFAAEFKAKTGADAWASKKARLKLLAAAENVSPGPPAVTVGGTGPHSHGGRGRRGGGLPRQCGGAQQQPCRVPRHAPLSGGQRWRDPAGKGEGGLLPTGLPARPLPGAAG